MILVPLHRAAVDAAWPLFGRFAEQMAATFPDDWPVDEIRRQAIAGYVLLWLVWSPDESAAYGLVGTEIQLKPSGRRALIVALAAGRQHRKWVHLMEQLERYGAEQGCDYSEIRGRAGWAAHFSDYRAKHGIILKKDLR